MSRSSKLAVGALLLAASACPAFPLYYEVHPVGSGPPQRILWSGAPWRSSFSELIIVVPQFWTFSAFCVSGMAWVFIGRLGWAIASLALALAGYASLGIAGARILPGSAAKAPVFWVGNIAGGPETAFHVAVFTLLIALGIILLGPRASSPSPDRP